MKKYAIISENEQHVLIWHCNSFFLWLVEFPAFILPIEGVTLLLQFFQHNMATDGAIPPKVHMTW